MKEYITVRIDAVIFIGALTISTAVNLCTTASVMIATDCFVINQNLNISQFASNVLDSQPLMRMTWMKRILYLMVLLKEKCATNAQTHWKKKNPLLCHDSAEVQNDNGSGKYRDPDTMN